VDWCLSFLFCSAGLHICFCASTMMFLVLWRCSIVWSQVLWYLCVVLFLSIALVIQMRSFVLPNEHYDWFFNWFFNFSIDSTNPWAWKIFSSSVVIFYLFLQWFIVFLVKVFHILG
jgi:hypothetical protein